MRSGMEPEGRWARVALLVAATGTSLLIAEICLRLLPDSVLGFVYDGGRFHPPREFEPHLERNSVGSHDVEYAPKRPGTRRVLLLGDSFVQGLQVPVAQTVSRRLERRLSERSSRAWDVVSLAGPGFGPAQELDLFRKTLTPRSPRDGR